MGFKESETRHIKLLEELKEGSYSAFNELYTSYADLLYGFVLGISKSPSQSKDIVQESFLRIWNTRENIDSSLSFKSYLYTIARNLIINALRKQSRYVAFDQYVDSECFQTLSSNSVEHHIYYDEFLVQFEKAKRELTDRQRLIFELYKEQDQSIAEIMARLNISEKTIRNTLSITLKILIGKKRIK